MLDAKIRAPEPRSIQKSDEGAMDAAIGISPCRAVNRYSLRVPVQEQARMQPLRGENLLMSISRFEVVNGVTFARLGPDEWLVFSEADDAAIEADIVEALSDLRYYSLVDIGHRDVAFRVSGRHSRDVINSGCPQDLSLTAFPPGTVVRTVFGKVEVILFRLHEGATFQIECGRSFCEYVKALMQDAALEFVVMNERPE
jgi:sarcosine oxidase subunit gamma